MLTRAALFSGRGWVLLRVWLLLMGSFQLAELGMDAIILLALPVGIRTTCHPPPKPHTSRMLASMLVRNVSEVHPNAMSVKSSQLHHGIV